MNNTKAITLEMTASILLALAFFYKDSVSFIAGFFGILVVLDLIITNLRRIDNHG